MNQQRKSLEDDNHLLPISALSRRDAVLCWQVSQAVGEMSGNSHPEAVLEVPRSYGDSWRAYIPDAGPGARMCLVVWVGAQLCVCGGGGEAPHKGKARKGAWGEAGSRFSIPQNLKFPMGPPPL